MDSQKTKNSQSNLEKEEHSWMNLILDSKPYYKAVIVKKNTELAQKWAHTPMEQNQELRDKPVLIWSISP